MYLCKPSLKILDKENFKKPEFIGSEKIEVISSFSNKKLKVAFMPSNKAKTKEPIREDLEND
jgi:hypothetical protein